MARDIVRETTAKLMDMAIDGIGLYVVDKAVGYLEPYLEKTTGQFTKPVIKIALGLVSPMIPQLDSIPYVGDWLEIASRVGMSEALTVIVDKPAYCKFDDINTIHCYHFDTTQVRVYIDGAEVMPSGISGTPDDFTISLPSPVSSGAHDLVVAGLKRAFSGRKVA